MREKILTVMALFHADLFYSQKFFGVFVFGLILLMPVFVTAQTGIKHTDNKADKILKSDARVNPSTLAMEFSLSLTSYRGRAGNSLPVVMNYSSKVWGNTLPRTFQDFSGPRGIIYPYYAKESKAGWTSSLGVPKIDTQQYLYVSGPEVGEGQPWELGNPEPLYYPVYQVKKVHVVMPDGSSHEFRKDDGIHNCGQTQSSNCTPDYTGTYLTTDGSRMRLEMDNPTVLYLPDGSRYIFPNSLTNETVYIDEHGNKMSYNPATKEWGDTLGRIIKDPLPDIWNQFPPEEGIFSHNFPSLNGGTQTFYFVWEKLSNHQSTLSYTSNIFCNPNGSFSPIPQGANNLFSNAEVITCSSATPFDPVILREIRLPDGTKYKFSYNTFGEIEKIEYPTGGYERFEYIQVEPVASTREYGYDQLNRGVRKRFISSDGTSASEIQWRYEILRETSPTSGGAYHIKTFAPDGTWNEQLIHDEWNDSAYPYGFGNSYIGRAYETRHYSATNVLMRRTLTKWTQTGALTINGVAGYQSATRDLRPQKEVSIIFEPSSPGNALVQISETEYDTSGNSDPQYFAALNPKQTKTYNYIVLDVPTAQTANIDQLSALFSNSNLATITEIDYLYDANYKVRNITGLVTETRVKDASGNIKAKNQIGYDEAAYPLIYTGTDTQWQDPTTNYRGNPTTTRSWFDITNNQAVETHAQYDNFGNLRKTWDAKGNVSEVEYSSTYNYAYPTKTISPIPDASGANGSSTRFETTIVYDFTTGLPLSTTDVNGQTSQIEYNDALLRPTKTIAPNGHQTITEYGAGTSSATRFVKIRTQIDEQKWQKGYSWYDGVGRTIKSQSVDSAGDVFTETEYDNMSRPKKVTNPYRANETKLWTESFYDDLNRITKIKTPDNAEVLTAYNLATTGANIGTVVTVTDQADKQRRSITNALGQLTRVDEPNDSNQLGIIDAPTQPTFYSYDTLNNLTQVTQGSQTRSFVYDSLSRLKQATNPEAGTMQYQYDLNGNLQMKTDARGITTTFAYDNLNRVKTRSYSDTTPPVSYFYDNLQNAKGKLIKVSSSISTTEYTAFDILGRVLAHKQTTDGQNYTTGYSYNLSGALIEETYPSGRVVKNVLDADGDLSIVQSKKNQNSGYFNYAKNFTYTAAGAVSSMQLGNGKWESTSFNARLQPTQIALGTVQNATDKLKLNYDYGTTQNNGNVLSQQITVPTVGANQGFTATQNYTYDSLNRLKSATETISNQQTWKQTFLYDRLGNRNFDAANTTTLGSCPQAQCNPTIDTANNRFTTGQGYTFDLAGNLITDAQGRSFIYDAENKQKSVTNTSGTIGTYLYDGDGKRVKKVSATEETIFVYDAAGKLVAEYSNQIATNPQVSYLTNDNLGTPRINTDANGAVIARHDYLPFGEEIYTPQRNQGIGYQDDSVRNQFASYERDNETNLDFAQARYYGGNYGRFTSPDPIAGSCINPQSHNKYAYAWNNPLILTDPTGMTVSWEDSEKKKEEGETEAKTAAQRKYEKRLDEMIKSKDKKTQERGLKLKATYERLQKSDITFHVVKENPSGASSGELTYKGEEGHLYVNLKGDNSAYGALTDIQKIAHEFKHGEQFLDSQIGFLRNDKGEWKGYRDDLPDEAEAFITGFEAQPLDPAQRGNKFLNAVESARSFGLNAVVDVLDRQGPYQ